MTVNGHKPRNTLPAFSHAYKQSSHEFVPAVAIRRPVIMEQDEALLLEEQLSDALHSKEVPKNFAKYCKILPPNQWRVTLLEERKFVEELNSLSENEQPDAKDMWNFAKSLRSNLLSRLEDQSTLLPMSFGEPNIYGSTSPKPFMGMTPSGWKGTRANYEEFDEMNEQNPLGAVVAENLLCISAISDRFSLNVDEAVNALVVEPHVTVLKNSHGFRPHEFRAVRPILREIIPEVLVFGDPVMHLHKSAGTSSYQKIPIRSTLLQPQELEQTTANFALAG
jgi:hypothetical protein